MIAQTAEWAWVARLLVCIHAYHRPSFPEKRDRPVLKAVPWGEHVLLVNPWKSYNHKLLVPRGVVQSLGDLVEETAVATCLHGHYSWAGRCAAWVCGTKLLAALPAGPQQVYLLQQYGDAGEGGLQEGKEEQGARGDKATADGGGQRVKEEERGVRFPVKKFRSSCFVLEESPHPWRKFEKAVWEVAQALRSRPTVPLSPEGRQWSDEECAKGIAFPVKHCPFRGCEWTGEEDVELVKHIEVSHQSVALQTAARCLPGEGAIATYSVVNAAMACVSQQEAPLVSFGHDRRALRVFAEAVRDPELQGLICFVCGCVHPFIPGEQRQLIRWEAVCSPESRDGEHVCLFLGMSSDETEACLGVATYVQRYGNQGAGYPNLLEEPWAKELQQWVMQVPFVAGPLSVLCNGEDRCCRREHTAGRAKELCVDCSVPLCHACRKDLFARPRMFPVRALSNNLWTGYASPIVTEAQATYMELLVASPCILSLICFTLEVSHGSVLRDVAQKQRVRVGARGNITLFPLPLADILEALRQGEGQVELPWSGREVANAVRVVLRTSDVNDAKLIFQTTVRRQVVVALILDCLQRGHPSYRHLSKESVCKKAAELPENGILEELVSVDGGKHRMDELHANKAATPAPAPEAPGTAFVALRVLARSQVVSYRVELSWCKSGRV